MAPRGSIVIHTVWIVLILGCQTWGIGKERAIEFYNKGNTYRESGRLEESAEFYRKALELRPNMAAAVYNLALLSVELGRHEDAMEGLLRLLEQDPMNLKVLRALGWAAWESGDAESAIAFYTRVLDVFPADETALKDLAHVYEATGKFREALELRRFLIRLDDSEITHQELADALLSSGDEEGALAEYEWVLAHSPSEGEVLLNAAAVAESLGYNEKAASYYLQAAEESSAESAEAWQHLTELFLLKLANYSEGVAALKSLLETEFSDEEFLSGLVESLPAEIRGTVEELINAQESP